MPKNVRVELRTLRIEKLSTSPQVIFLSRPYLWAVFFKIDDANGTGDPVATVVGSRGSHGNLGVGTITDNKMINIPPAVGQWETTLRELPSRQGTINGLVKAAVGVVVVLMEEDNVTDDGAEAGRKALVSKIQEVIEGFAGDLGAAAGFDANDQAALAKEVTKRVKAAVRAQQNVFENIWSWLDKDDQIGSDIYQQLYDSVPTGEDQSIRGSWDAEFMRWSIEGGIKSFTETSLRFSRAAINFGNVRTTMIASRSFRITNYTDEEQVNLTFELSGSGEFSISPQSVVIRRSSYVDIDVTFRSLHTGIHSGSIKIMRHNPTEVIGTISVKGHTPEQHGPLP